MTRSPSPWQPTRRGFLTGSLAGSLAGSHLGLAGLPAGGLFVTGSERLRIGLVGCGGRGTGAARQAAGSHPGVAIVALGDLFADQVAESAALLEAELGPRFACPPERRFVGHDAWRQVLDAELDAVILAATPWSRPGHVAGAVARGLHVYCEKPAATDLAGARTVLAACAEAESRGLVVMSGLASRHDAAIAATIARIQAGSLGRPLVAECRAWLGLPWQRPHLASWTAEEARQRNWVADPRLSGGPLVERHLDAIDRGLWALGDECPVQAAPVETPAARAGGLAVRYRFADGRELRAEIVRRSAAPVRIEERLMGTLGSADLCPPTGDGQLRQGRREPQADPWQTCMSRFAAAAIRGTGGDGGRAVCRATLVALLGRLAAETGRVVGWEEVAGPPAGGIERTAAAAGIIGIRVDETTAG